MSLIAIHDAETEHFKKAKTFPNYALMKISSYHKSLGDTVVWFNAMERDLYDKVYSSKVFDFTPENPYLPPDTIKGGTGYGKFESLPDEIDNMFPDYSIYPECDYAIGFITRGCINKCRWCVVPKKEGMIRPYRGWRDLIREDTNKLVLMDNNILACEHGINQLREIAEDGTISIDLNQGMDLRLVTPEITDILAKIKWIKYIRFSVDQKSQIKHLKKVAEYLSERGVKTSKLFLYCLITKDMKDDVERIYAIRDICPNATIYAQAEVNPTLGIMPDNWQKMMAQKYVYSGQWRKINWDEWVKTHSYLFGKDDEIYLG